MSPTPPPATAPTKGQPISLLLADDHPLLLCGLEERLVRHGPVRIVGLAADGEECVALYQRHRPDVVLCDLQLPKLSGVEVARTLQQSSGANVVIFSAYDDDASIQAAVDAGAVGYLVKTVDAPELYECLLDAAAGRPVFDRVTAGKVIAALRETNPTVVEEKTRLLSPRELEVLQALGDGLSTVELAEKLYISPLTVKTHVSRIMSKLEVNQRSAAVSFGLRSGLIK